MGKFFRKFLKYVPLVGSLAVIGRSLWLGSLDPLYALHTTETRLPSSSQSRRNMEEGTTFPVEVIVKHDGFPADISWSLKGDNGNVVARRVSSRKDSLKQVSVVTPVVSGTYELELKDSFGDGLCCTEIDRDGYYKLIVNGQTLAVGGEFADTTGPIKFKIEMNGDVVLLDKAVLGLQQDCSPSDPARFNICLYVASKEKNYSNDWILAFHAAKNRWEAVVVGDTHSAIDTSGSPREWQYPAELDDTYIRAEAIYIDGPYKILGASGPTTMLQIGKKNPITGHYFRQTLTGNTLFDTADITRLIQDGTYESVIIHEMGHVLGIGSMWTYNGLHSGNLSDPVYKGVYAQREYKKLGFPGQLQVETDYGEGTAGGHWDEACLRSELMTGVAHEQMPLSRITVGGLEDLGYKVNYSAADPFEVPPDAECGTNGNVENAESRVCQLAGKSRRKLSDTGMQEAIGYGKALLAKNQKVKEWTRLAKNEYFIAHQVLQVLYEEDGHLYGVEIHGTKKAKMQCYRFQHNRGQRSKRIQLPNTKLANRL